MNFIGANQSSLSSKDQSIRMELINIPATLQVDPTQHIPIDESNMTVSYKKETLPEEE